MTIIPQKSISEPVSKDFETCNNNQEDYFREWTVRSGVPADITRVNPEDYTLQELSQFLNCRAQSGGWVVSGVDVRTGLKQRDFGQAKPYKPWPDKDGEIPKYRFPYGGKYEAIALAHPSGGGYWTDAVADVTIPIALTEGSKKAGALMGCGFHALSFCGCGLWHKKGNDEQLVSNLNNLAKPGRGFTVLYDADSATNPNVRNELRKLGETLTLRGCRVSVAQWDIEQGKGIDDVLVVHGEERVREIIESAEPFYQWRSRWYFGEARSAKGFQKKSAPKLDREEVAVQAKEVLSKKWPELDENLKLEALRENCGMSSYDWDRKILRPLKRELEGERFKLELLGLMAIEDPVERFRVQAFLAPKYQMSSATLDKALAAMKGRVGTTQSKSMDFGQLLDLESVALQWLIPELLPRGETVLLTAQPKDGKTLLAIDAAYAIATGESDFLGERVPRGKVLFVSVDESLQSTKAKLQRRGFRRQDAENLRIRSEWDLSQMHSLEAELEDYRPDLVIVDSLKRITHGSLISENSAEFADTIYSLKEMLTRYGASGLLIHHSNKRPDAAGTERTRGSSAIPGAVWGSWQIERILEKNKETGRLTTNPSNPRRYFQAFNRDSDGLRLEIEFCPEDNSWTRIGEVGEEDHAEESQSTRDRILSVLERNKHRQLNGAEILELSGLGEQRSTCYRELSKMVSKRLISSRPAPGDKRYNLYSLPGHPIESLVKEPEELVVSSLVEISPPPPSPLPYVGKRDYQAERYIGEEVRDSLTDSPTIVSDSLTQLFGKSPQAPEIKTLEIVSPQTNTGEGGGVEKNQVTQIPQLFTQTNQPEVYPPPPIQFKVGDKVWWHASDPYWRSCVDKWKDTGGCEIQEILGDKAKIELFKNPVPLVELSFEPPRDDVFSGLGKKLPEGQPQVQAQPEPQPVEVQQLIQPDPEINPLGKNQPVSQSESELCFDFEGQRWAAEEEKPKFEDIPLSSTEVVEEDAPAPLLKSLQELRALQVALLCFTPNLDSRIELTFDWQLEVLARKWDQPEAEFIKVIEAIAQEPDNLPAGKDPEFSRAPQFTDYPNMKPLAKETRLKKIVKDLRAAGEFEKAIALWKRYGSKVFQWITRNLLTHADRSDLLGLTKKWVEERRYEQMEFEMSLE